MFTLIGTPLRLLSLINKVFQSADPPNTVGFCVFAPILCELCVKISDQ